MPKINRNRNKIISDLSSYKVYVGIDPGVKGGLSWVDSNGDAECISMPKTERDIWEWFTELPAGDVRAVIEKSWPRPGNAAGSTFKFGTNYGFLRACLIASGISFQEVSPQRWIKSYEIVKKKGEKNSNWKNRLKGIAQQLYPDVKIRLDAADSLLIAGYCYKSRIES